MIDLPFDALQYLIQSVASGEFGVVPFESIDEFIQCLVSIDTFDLPYFGLVIIEFSELSIDSFKESFNARFDLKKFIIDVHQSIQISHLKLLFFNQKLRPLGNPLLNHAVLNGSYSRLSGLFYERCPNQEKSH
jgi:hypothetical protein